MNARYNIGFARNEGPAEASDTEQAIADWLAACPFSFALGQYEESKIACIVADAYKDWSLA